VKIYQISRKIARSYPKSKQNHRFCINGAVISGGRGQPADFGAEMIDFFFCLWYNDV
jgi:hypothetical protein